MKMRRTGRDRWTWRDPPPPFSTPSPRRFSGMQAPMPGISAAADEAIRGHLHSKVGL